MFVRVVLKNAPRFYASKNGSVLKAKNPTAKHGRDFERVAQMVVFLSQTTQHIKPQRNQKVALDVLVVKYEETSITEHSSKHQRVQMALEVPGGITTCWQYRTGSNRDTGQMHVPRK